MEPIRFKIIFDQLDDVEEAEAASSLVARPV